MPPLPPPPPLLPFLRLRPFQIVVGALLGWMLRGRREQNKPA